MTSNLPLLKEHDREIPRQRVYACDNQQNHGQDAVKRHVLRYFFAEHYGRASAQAAYNTDHDIIGDSSLPYYSVGVFVK